MNPILRLAVLLAAIAVAPAWSTATDLPRVRLISTGGTIAASPDARLSGQQLLALLPQLSSYAQPEVEEFTNLPSTRLTLGQWLELTARINDTFRRDATLAGIVVTSGTDTLEELAYFLHLTVDSDRPVVLVGAMRSPGTPGYDGAANLLAGFRVAADPASRGKGVLVVMNDEIGSAREVAKRDAIHVEAFDHPYGRLGSVDPDRVVYYRNSLKRHTKGSEFAAAPPARLPRVDVILTYQDAPADLIKAAVDGGASGIVLATAGAGSMSGTQLAGVDYALERGAIVVIASRTGAGRISAPQMRERAPPHDTAARIAAEDLPPLKARILLMLALSRTRTPSVIQRMFLEY